MAWEETDHYVDMGTVELTNELHVLSPCEILLALPIPISQPPIVQTQVLVHHVPVMVHNQHPHNNLEQKEENRTMKRQAPNEIAFHKCQEIFNREVLGAIARFATNGHQKRIIYFLAGFFISDIYQTIRSRVLGLDSSNLDKRVDLLRVETQHLMRAINVTELTDQAIGQSLKYQSMLIKQNQKILSEVITNIPTVAVVTSYTINKIMYKGQQLHRLRDSIEARQIDLVSLYEIFEQAEFKNTIHPSTIQIKHTAAPLPNVLQITLRGQMLDRSTKIFKIISFETWSNLTGDPMLAQYAGPPFVLYNTTANCTLGIQEPVRKGVSVRCSRHNYSDQALKLWSKKHSTTNIIKENTSTTVKQNFPYNHIYCFGQNISISNLQYTPCPPYVFILNATIQFKTTDNITNPEITESILDLTDNITQLLPHIELSHANDMMKVDDTEHIMKVQQLLNENRRLRQDRILLRLGDGEITVGHAASVGWVSVGVLAIITTGLVYCYLTKINKNSTLILKTVADGLHGEGTYEELVKVKKSRNNIPELPMRSFRIIKKSNRRPSH